MSRHTPCAVLLAVLLSAGCASVTAPAPTPAPSTPPQETAAATPSVPEAVLWTATAAEHRAAYLQAFRQAAVVLEQLVEGRRPYTWAVSLDADETVLSNVRYEIERASQGLGFDAASWAEWVHREEAAALPGARDFLETVRRLGGHIAIVTNRSESLCPPTAANLRAQRLPYDVVLCKPDDGPSDKTPRWKAVQEGTASQQLPPLELVMWIGDNIHDFPGGSQEWAGGSEDAVRWFGERFFVLPNPMYGSWTDNPLPPAP